jgi:hypothetical protein
MFTFTDITDSLLTKEELPQGDFKIDPTGGFLLKNTDSTDPLLDGEMDILTGEFVWGNNEPSEYYLDDGNLDYYAPMQFNEDYGADFYWWENDLIFTDGNAFWY